jgi:hypothetical protein
MNSKVLGKAVAPARARVDEEVAGYGLSVGRVDSGLHLEGAAGEHEGYDGALALVVEGVTVVQGERMVVVVDLDDEAAGEVVAEDSVDRASHPRLDVG